MVSHTSPRLISKPNPVQIRASKKQELETKKAIDRANAVLHRLEQRLSHYDAQIRCVCQQYVELLEQRRACAQRKRDRLEDQILKKLSAANIDRGTAFTGFPSGFLSQGCPGRQVVGTNCSVEQFWSCETAFDQCTGASFQF